MDEVDAYAAAHLEYWLDMSYGQVRLPVRNPMQHVLSPMRAARPDMAYSQGVRQVIHQMFGPGGKYDPKGPNKRTDWAVGPPICEFDPCHDGPFLCRRTRGCRSCRTCPVGGRLPRPVLLLGTLQSLCAWAGMVVGYTVCWPRAHK